MDSNINDIFGSGAASGLSCRNPDRCSGASVEANGGASSESNFQSNSNRVNNFTEEIDISSIEATEPSTNMTVTNESVIELPPSRNMSNDLNVSNNFAVPLLESPPPTNSCSSKDSVDSPINRMIPSDMMKLNQNPLPYKEPSQCGISKKRYSIEILKNGIIVNKIDLNSKSFYVFGRLTVCDVVMEHPSLSRYHAVMQCFPSSEGTCDWHLFDLNSTHGTMLNSRKIKGNEYYPLKVGHMIKFAGSSRMIILQGPEDEEEKESELTVTELKQEYQAKKHAYLKKIKEQDEEPDIQMNDEKNDEGCGWGMGEDAINDESVPSMTELPEHEHLYIDDPKKALKSYFEREGWDIPEYKFGDEKLGSHNCYVELPVDSPSGEPLIAEVSVSGKKKEAVIACALEACRLLDRMGELHKSHQESRKRKGKNLEENDFYESDDDTYLDRTGIVEKKRLLRMKKAGKIDEKPETYESLSSQLESVQSEMSNIQKQLQKEKQNAPAIDGEGIDALDAYMNAIKCGSLDTKSRVKAKLRLMELKREENRLLRLVSITKPALLNANESSSCFYQSYKVKGEIHTGSTKNPGLPASEVPDHSGSCDEVGIDQNRIKSDENERQSGIAAENSLVNHNAQSVCKKPDSAYDANNEIKNDYDNLNHPKNLETTQIESKIQNSTNDIKISSKNEKKISSTDLKPLEKNRKSQNHDTICHKGVGILKKKISVKTKEIGSEDGRSDYCSSDPDYAVWLPPSDQSGDGRTHLNDKLGY